MKTKTTHYFNELTKHFLIRLTIGTYFRFKYNTHSFLGYTEQKERYGALLLLSVLSRKYLNCNVENRRNN